MRFGSYLVVFGCCSELAACSAPGPEYHFTADQLAWQSYQEGQVLRFGNARTAAVRTYRVTRVLNDMTSDSRSWSFREPPKYQRVNAFLQRTDSIGNEFVSLGLSFNFDHPSVVPGNEFMVTATLDWDTPPAVVLPIDELDRGLPIDTMRYSSVRLLPTRTLGLATYASVVQYTPRARSISGLTNPTTELYLTKANGVVGFVQRNTLWYRVP